MAEYSQKCNNGTSKTRSTETSDGLAAIQAQLNNLGREIKKFGAPFQQGGQYRAAALGFYQRNNANPSYQEQRQSMEESLRKFIRDSIKTLEIQIGQMSNVLQERGFGSLPSSTKTTLRDHVKSISTTFEADMTLIRRIGSSEYVISAQQNSKLMFESRRKTILFPSHLNDCYYDEKKGSYGLQCLDAYSFGATGVDDSLPRKEKDLGSFTLPCYIYNVCFENALVDLGARVSVMPLLTYLNLGLGELAHTKLKVELADRTVKHPKGIAKNVLVGIERMDLDLEARLMGETLVLNRSLDPSYEDYIELNDLNVPLELRRDQVDDLMPTIKESGVIDEPMIDIIKTMNNESFDEYLSFCDFDRKIHIDCAYNLRFSYMIGFEHINANFFPILSVKVMSREFYNSITKDKVESKGKNVKIWMATEIKTWEILFLENRSAKLHVWKQEAEWNLVSVPKAQKFLQGVLNLGPEYVRDAKMEV
ncbi:mitochondrial proton/calcium exchanger protein-like protein isoform X1 [Tanacetum coccineum]